MPPSPDPRTRFRHQLGYEVDKGEHIVICQTCGATNDLTDDSTTCQECFDSDAEFEPKYGILRGIPRRAELSGEKGGGVGGVRVEDEREGTAVGKEGDVEMLRAEGGSGARGAGAGLEGLSARERERELWLRSEKEKARGRLTGVYKRSCVSDGGRGQKSGREEIR